MRACVSRSLWLLLPMLGACCPANPVKQTWLPSSSDYWQGTVASGVTLRLRDGSARHIAGEVMGTILTVKRRLETVSGVGAELALVHTDEPNAYAKVHAGRPIIALSLSYLDRFGSDEDALAATLGHELAHLHLGHSAVAEHRNGIALSGGFGAPSGASELDATARDNEREADSLGLKWASAAGFDPCAQVRILHAMSRDIPAASTHPAFAERAATASAAAKKAAGRRCE